MTNYSVGHEAETVAAEYLKSLGFAVVELNWKTRYCEIDIVAKRKKVVHFIEVKYRANNFQGNGYEYVGSHKLLQMKFAADLWIANHKWQGDSELGVVSIDGNEVSYFNVAG